MKRRWIDAEELVRIANDNSYKNSMGDDVISLGTIKQLARKDLNHIYTDEIDISGISGKKHKFITIIEDE